MKPKRITANMEVGAEQDYKEHAKCTARNAQVKSDVRELKGKLHVLGTSQYCC